MRPLRAAGEVVLGGLLGLVALVVIGYLATGVTLAFFWLMTHPVALVIWVAGSSAAAFVVAAFLRAGQGPPTA